MRYPNKLVSYRQSVICHFPELLLKIKNQSVSPAELYHSVQSNYSNVGEFAEALDCLFSLGCINYETQTGRLLYVV